MFEYDDNSKTKNTVTYRFERHSSYPDGEAHTDVKVMSLDGDCEDFNTIHNYFYGWLRSSFGHLEAPRELSDFPANLTWDEL